MYALKNFGNTIIKTQIIILSVIVPLSPVLCHLVGPYNLGLKAFAEWAYLFLKESQRPNCY